VNTTYCFSSSCGTAFSLNLTNNAETMLYSFCSQQNCSDGADPNAGVIDVNGVLYGTTAEGGAYSAGTAFSIIP
jgi:hypothetical protein